MQRHADPGRRRFDRRSLLQAGAAAAAAPMVAGLADAPAARASGGFDVVEASIADLQAALSSGALTSRTLVRAYLERIRRIDRAGPRLNTVLELNPDAEAIARQLDRERRAGHVRGPLHGI